MKRSIRYLRIAFSATCLIACVLTIALWVRSYWLIERIDVVSGTEDEDTTGISLISVCGRFTLDVTNVTTGDEPGIEYHSYPPDPAVEYLGIGRVLFMSKSQPGWLVSLPYWLSTSFIGTLAALPWIPWSRRFSLRTLLIATTLVAVVLGLIVWSIR